MSIALRRLPMLASVAAAAAAAAVGVPSAAHAATDRTRPVITDYKVTPQQFCAGYSSGASPFRRVSFTLSEPARVTLIKLDAFFGIPGPSRQVTIPLEAGSHTLGESESAGEPSFPFKREHTFREGWFVVQARDAAGNRSPQRWSRYLWSGEEASGRGPGTFGC